MYGNNQYPPGYPSAPGQPPQYPPQQQGYPPQPQGYPPQPQAPGYPVQYPPQQGYPPTAPGYAPQPGYPAQQQQPYPYPPPPQQQQQYYAAQGRQLFAQATNATYPYPAQPPVGYVVQQPPVYVQQPGYVAYPGVIYGGKMKHKHKHKGYKYKGYKRKGFKFFKYEINSFHSTKVRGFIKVTFALDKVRICGQLRHLPTQQQQQQDQKAHKMVGTRLHVVVSFVLFALAASPFAWRFTQIERVELPVDRIQRLSWQQSRFAQPDTFSVAIFTLADDNEKSSGQLQKAPLSSSAAGRIQYAAGEIIRINAAQRLELRNAKSLQQVDDLLARIVSAKATASSSSSTQRQFSVLLLCDDAAATAPLIAKDAVVVGKYRHAWSWQCALSQNTKLFHAVEKLVQQHVFPVESAEAATTKRARTALKYRLQFALLKENPQLPWQWDFSTTLFPKFLQKFVEKVSVLANFSVESEVFHYARLAKEIHASDDGQSYYIKADDLKQFKSANDFLTSSVLDDREQVLHFMAALPELEHSPLGILSNGDQTTSSSHLASSFEIPGWGGVVILNTTRLLSGSAEDAVLEKKQMMGVFLTQFRTLIGAPSFHERQRVEASASYGKLTFLASPRDGIADWELDVIVRSLFKLHLKAAISTLQSIVQLVDEMTQMSVLERVQQRIVAALTLIEDILCTSEQRDQQQQQCAASAATDLSELLVKVREAADHTDAAYYDHTMIRQLYFPQEQMFGVYAPLLAPLILPFFIGLIREFKRWKTKKAEKLKKLAE